MTRPLFALSLGFGKRPLSPRGEGQGEAASQRSHKTRETSPALPTIPKVPGQTSPRAPSQISFIEMIRSAQVTS
jgi:hypothetical protein